MWRRWSWLTVLALLVAACGGPAGADADADAAASSEASGGGDVGAGDGGSGNGGGSGTGEDDPGDAPVTATLEGTTYVFPVGTCSVADDRVDTEAGTEVSGRVSDPGASALGFVDVSWQSDESVAEFHVYSADTEAPAPFELYAGANRAGTAWDVSVDGATATIEARMVNELPAVRDDPVAFHDVTIRIACAERGFGGMPAPDDSEGSGMPLPPDATPEASEESRIALTLGGTTYAYTQLGCPMLEDYFAFVVADADLNRLFVATEEATLVRPDGTSWGATGIDWAGDPDRYTWSGTMSSPSGGTEPATIEIEC